MFFSFWIFWFKISLQFVSAPTVTEPDDRDQHCFYAPTKEPYMGAMYLGMT